MYPFHNTWNQHIRRLPDKVSRINSPDSASAIPIADSAFNPLILLYLQLTGEFFIHRPINSSNVNRPAILTGNNLFAETTIPALH